MKVGNREKRPYTSHKKKSPYSQEDGSYGLKSYVVRIKPNRLYEEESRWSYEKKGVGKTFKLYARTKPYEVEEKLYAKATKPYTKVPIKKPYISEEKLYVAEGNIIFTPHHQAIRGTKEVVHC